jgi:hypothetical protein
VRVRVRVRERESTCMPHQQYSRCIDYALIGCVGIGSSIDFAPGHALISNITLPLYDRHYPLRIRVQSVASHASNWDQDQQRQAVQAFALWTKQQDTARQDRKIRLATMQHEAAFIADAANGFTVQFHYSSAQPVTLLLGLDPEIHYTVWCCTVRCSTHACFCVTHNNHTCALRCRYHVRLTLAQ